MLGSKLAVLGTVIIALGGNLWEVVSNDGTTVM